MGEHEEREERGRQGECRGYGLWRAIMLMQSIIGPRWIIVGPQDALDSPAALRREPRTALLQPACNLLPAPADGAIDELSRRGLEGVVKAAIIAGAATRLEAARGLRDHSHTIRQRRQQQQVGCEGIEPLAVRCRHSPSRRNSHVAAPAPPSHLPAHERVRRRVPPAVRTQDGAAGPRASADPREMNHGRGHFPEGRVRHPAAKGRWW